MVEQTVRMAGKQEKISTSFLELTDFIRGSLPSLRTRTVFRSLKQKHVEKAIEAKKYRSSMFEDHIQEMIDRGTLKIDVHGEATGQVNGLAVYAMGDYAIWKTFPHYRFHLHGKSGNHQYRTGSRHVRKDS